MNICTDPNEIQKYKEYYAKKHNVKPDDIEIIELKFEFNQAYVTYKNKKENKFERIRRITGYLTGTLDQWNDAKRAEERERVKHTGMVLNINNIKNVNI